MNAFKTALQDLSKKSDIKVIKNSTLNIDNITAYKIDYKNITKETNQNISNAYVFTCNHTFLIKLQNYDDDTELNENLEYVVAHMTPDFKQSQD